MRPANLTFSLSGPDQKWEMVLENSLKFMNKELRVRG